MTPTTDLSGASWVKSSFSSDGGQCIEVAPAFAASGIMPVRDSKDPEGPALLFPVGAFAAFVAEVKGGGFDAH